MKKTKKNNWYVITGAPCSGKTSLLKILENKGFKVVYELARKFIDRELKKGKTIDEIRKDELAFQKKILKLKINYEKTLNPNEVIFFERAIPDTIAYYKMCGVIKDPFLDKALLNCFYKKIFLLKLVNYNKDYARVETKTQAKTLEGLLKESYKKTKITLIKVPKMSLSQRVEYILNNL